MLPELACDKNRGNLRASRELEQYAVFVERSLLEKSLAELRIFAKRPIVESVPMRIESVKIIRKHLGSELERVFQGISG
jgi:hypothetical protein